LKPKVTLALTPALSPGERGRRAAVFGDALVVVAVAAAPTFAARRVQVRVLLISSKSGG